jgi:hypothetical protein
VSLYFIFVSDVIEGNSKPHISPDLFKAGNFKISQRSAALFIHIELHAGYSGI